MLQFGLLHPVHEPANTPPLIHGTGEATDLLEYTLGLRDIGEAILTSRNVEESYMDMCDIMASAREGKGLCFALLCFFIFSFSFFFRIVFLSLSFMIYMCMCVDIFAHYSFIFLSTFILKTKFIPPDEFILTNAH